MKNIGLFVKRGSTQAATVAQDAIEWLLKNNCTPLFDSELTVERGIPGGATLEEVAEKSEIIVVLGGDGTFLAGAQLAFQKRIPILGVNLGGLGFLTNTPVDEIYQMLDLIVTDRCEYEDRAFLEVIVHNGEKRTFNVLNDVVIGKNALARIIQIQVKIEEEVITQMLADGLIASTPTGSTAYSMAAGGPICHPEVGAIILTPICPHLLANRPLLVPDTSTLKIELIEDGESFVTLDGQVGMELKNGDIVEVKRSAYTLKVVHNTNRTYYQTLTNKLRWGKR